MKPTSSKQENPRTKLPALPPLATPTTKHAPPGTETEKTNPNSTVQRIYPWLLCTSTALAAAFCLAYISKPVVSASQSHPPAIAIAPTVKSPPATPSSEPATPVKPSNPTPLSENPPPEKTKPDLTYEETNLRVQHVLDVEAGNGEIKRIVIDVPSVYKSRNLRWDQTDAAEARELLEALAVHQENVRTLRDTASVLQTRWNQLLERSIPAQALRADSPSLPGNQTNTNTPNHLPETPETIKLNKPIK